MTIRQHLNRGGVLAWPARLPNLIVLAVLVVAAAVASGVAQRDEPPPLGSHSDAIAAPAN